MEIIPFCEFSHDYTRIVLIYIYLLIPAAHAPDLFSGTMLHGYGVWRHIYIYICVSPKNILWSILAAYSRDISDIFYHKFNLFCKSISFPTLILTIYKGSTGLWGFGDMHQQEFISTCPYSCRVYRTHILSQNSIDERIWSIIVKLQYSYCSWSSAMVIIYAPPPKKQIFHNYANHFRGPPIFITSIVNRWPVSHILLQKSTHFNSWNMRSLILCFNKPYGRHV